jgi:hypothetical protein
MKRRDFIAGLGGAAVWPLAARAQQSERIRRVGVLMPFDENDPEGELRYSVFTRALADLGWANGRNVRMDLRWGYARLGKQTPSSDINRIPLRNTSFSPSIKRSSRRP